MIDNFLNIIIFRTNALVFYLIISTIFSEITLYFLCHV